MSTPSEWLKELSKPWPDGEYKKSAIERAAKLTKLSYWRAFDIWYEKGIAPRPDEIEKIADAIEAKNERDTANELHNLKVRLARIEALFATGDANFHSPSIDHAREMARQLRDMGRPMAGRKGCVAT